MKNWITSIVKTNTIKQSFVAFSTTMVNGFLGAAFYILSARFLGPEDFGTVSVIITLLTLVASIGDMGTNAGIVRFVGQTKNSPKDDKRGIFLRLALKVKLLIAIVISVIGLLSSRFIADLVFTKPEFAHLIFIGFVGASGIVLFGFVTSSFQALQRFVAWGLFQIAGNFMRLLVLTGLFAFSFMNIERVLLDYSLIPVLFFVFGLLFFSFRSVKKGESRPHLQEFITYNFWVGSFSAISALASRLDIFLTARYLVAYEIGIYAAASQLVQIFPQIIGALGTVIAPKMASMDSIKAALRYTQKLSVMVIVISGGCLLLIPFVHIVVPYLLGEQYVSSLPIFNILLFSMIIFLLSVPIHNVIIYYFAYPKLFLVLSIVYAIIVLLNGVVNIPKFGGLGAAWGVLLAQLVNLLIPALWIERRLRKQKLSLFTLKL